MSAMLLERPEVSPDQVSIFDLLSEGRMTPAGGLAAHVPLTGDGTTFDELIVGAWVGLSASHTVACPACGGAMEPRRRAGGLRHGGECAGCSTVLS